MEFVEGARGPRKWLLRALSPWLDLHRVEGVSMEPTLPEGTLVLARRVGPKARVRAGDVVFADNPAGEGLVVKRVDSVFTQHYPDDGVEVAFLVGDNLPKSFDSRVYGPVPRTTVREVALAAMLPDGTTVVL